MTSFVSFALIFFGVCGGLVGILFGILIWPTDAHLFANGRLNLNEAFLPAVLWITGGMMFWVANWAICCVVNELARIRAAAEISVGGE
ncbi:MAG TPA: hypothetical protein VLN73_06935 [Alphaproteobacteria bacterium]|nr:hypothetical protein [Alphaproteobacteria bacterium]